jgi:hypothetical protein
MVTFCNIVALIDKTIIIKSCARHEIVYVIMKKMLFGFAVLMMMVATISVFANTQPAECTEHDHLSVTTQVSVQGTHCSGTVGCSCPGFSPITNGDVWQQSYCKHCSHKKSYHR